MVVGQKKCSESAESIKGPGVDVGDVIAGQVEGNQRVQPPELSSFEEAQLVLAQVETFEIRHMTEGSRWDGSDLVFGKVDSCDVVWDHAGDIRQVGDAPVVTVHDFCLREVSSAAFEAVATARKNMNQKKKEGGLHLHFFTLFCTGC